MDDARENRRTWLVCVLLAAAVAAVYAPVWRAGFVAFDDNDYVTGNPGVLGGLSWAGLVWAFSTVHASNWHPLTWISLQLDASLWGAHPLGFHLTNVVLHTANAVLFFLLWKRMTGELWRPAFVAAVFALHPTHVESVAWVSERKDVLSTFFWMLAVTAYVRAVKMGGAPSVASVIWFALGLMAKPMLVSLPIVLLILDAWPLGRASLGARRLVLEKAPFWLLAAASCAATLFASHRNGVVYSTDQVPLEARLENIPMSCVRYLGLTFWPSRLAVLYPYVFRWPLGWVAGATLCLTLVAVWVWRRRGQEPWLAAGWGWFLAMLLPVIGLVQTGPMSIADRYTYLAGSGLVVMVAWTKWLRIQWAAGLGIAALAACAALTFVQAGYWRDSESLFVHTLAVTHRNSVIESDLSNVLWREGRFAEAQIHAEQAVKLHPSMALAHYNLGQARLGQHLVAGALAEFETQVALAPNDFAARLNFGRVLFDNGLDADALLQFEKAAALAPHDSECRKSLAAAAAREAWRLATVNDPTERNGARAVKLALEAVAQSPERDPGQAGVLAAAYAAAGDFTKAASTAAEAEALAIQQGRTNLVPVLEQQRAGYLTGRPVRAGAPLGGGQ